MVSDELRRKALLQSLADNDKLPERPGFAAAMMKLMETPGARSSDPMFNRFPAKLPEPGRVITISTPQGGDGLFDKFMRAEKRAMSHQEFEHQYLTTWGPEEKPFDEEMLKRVADRPDDMIDAVTGVRRSALTSAATTSNAGTWFTIEDLERSKQIMGLGDAGKMVGEAVRPLTDSTKFKIKGREATEVWIDELSTDFKDNQTDEEIMGKLDVMKGETKAALEALAAEMQEFFQKPHVVSLLAPEALTVLQSAKGFAKVSHIGGEEFVPDKVYLGKKGKLIGTFKSKDAAAYQHMEMPIDDAISKLDGFFEVTEQACEDGYHARIKSIRSQVAAEREAEGLAEKADVYASIGFGSW